jgi:outer membrane protein assembly factor BamD (BamD/ComL family)
VDKRNAGSVVWVYWISFLISLIVFGFGLYQAITLHEWTLLATGCGCVIGVLVTWPLAMALQENREINCKQFEELVTPLNERLEQLSIMLNVISEQQLLSDRAKAVAFREKDREALRRAIQEEIARHDYEAATLLADDMERQFGYRQEAQRWREQVNERRNDVLRKQIGEATLVIDRHIRNEQWPEAHKEADNLLIRFPDIEQVRNLPNEINHRRDQYKQQLIESLREADARHDADGGVEILKKLDAYLSPAEAESIQDVARRIFRHKLENLRTQFSASVQEHNWQEALRVGDIIVNEFPNTQMAKEVRESMTSLQQRAAGLEPAAAV